MLLGMAVESELGFGLIEIEMKIHCTFEDKNSDKKGTKYGSIYLVSVLSVALRGVPVIVSIRYSYVSRTVGISGQTRYMFEHMLGDKRGQAEHLCMLEHSVGNKGRKAEHRDNAVSKMYDGLEASSRRKHRVDNTYNVV